MTSLLRGPSRRAWVHLLVLTVAVLFTGTRPAAAQPKADVIFHNGKVFTSDPANLYVQAVAVRGNRVQAVGGDAEVLALAGPGTQVFDLGGRTLIPGLNDAHVHALVPQGQQLNIPTFVPGPGPSFDEAVALIAQGASTHPPGTWLFVTVGTHFADDPRAHRFTLDQVAPNHPVKLEVWTGHGMYFNTLGLRTLGIAENEPDPFGGFYERVPGTDVLNGVVHEYAEHQVRRRFAERLSDNQIAEIYQNFADLAVRAGYTSVQDMAVGVPHGRSLKILAQVNPQVRWREICFPLTLDEPCFSGVSPAPLVSASGVKWIGDGTPVERLALLSEPYADRPSTLGVFNFTAADFDEIVDSGLHGNAQRRQLLFHLVGDAAIDTLLDQMEATRPAPFWRQRRTRIEHGDLVSPEDLPRVRDLGVVMVQNGTHIGLPDLPQRLTPERLAEAQPLRSLLNAGIPLALGSDAIGGQGNPYLDIFLASVHFGRPAEALTREEAVIAYTAGSAYAEFEEHRKGRLAPGQLADLAVLSTDIFTADPGSLIGTVSLLTMVDGRIVWDAGVVAPRPAPAAP